MTPRMSGIRINPTLSGRLCFGSHEMSAYQSLCAEIPHYHEQNGSKARKKNENKKGFQDIPAAAERKWGCVGDRHPSLRSFIK